MYYAGIDYHKLCRLSPKPWKSASERRELGGADRA